MLALLDNILNLLFGNFFGVAMPVALEVTLIVVLVALGIGVLPLLFQLRRTAKCLEAFLLSSSKDLSQIADDVHASRLRMDVLAGSLQVYMDEVGTIFQLMGEMGRTMKNLHTRFSSTIESASHNLGGIIGGASALWSFFKHRRASHESE